MKIPPDDWKGTFGGRLGMTYTETEPGRAVAFLDVRPEHCNPPGVCHGGAVFAFADDSMGGALHPLCPPGHLPTSTQVNIHFVRSSRPGERLRVEARVLSHGQRTALLESRVEDGQGRLVALLTASYLFVEARYADAPGEE